MAVLACAFAGRAQDPKSDDTKQLERALQSAISKGDLKEVRRVGNILVKKGTSDHVKIILKALPTSNLRVYWTLVELLHAIDAEAALAALADEVVGQNEKPEAIDLTAVVVRSRLANKDKLLSRLLADGSAQVRMLCIHELVCAERKEFVPRLIELMEREEKKKEPLADLTREALRGLRNLTGVDAGPSAASWRRWWEKNGEGFELPKVKSDSGGSGETVVSVLRRNRATQYEELKKGKKTQILIVRGDNYDADRIEEVLDKLQLPYTMISNNYIVDGLLDAKTTIAVFENCTPEGTAGKKLDQALRSYVEEGGFLFASDTAMEAVVWRAFPGNCKSGGMREKEFVDVCPAKGRLGDPFMRDIFQERFFNQWRMHAASVGFQAVSDKVIVLMEGPDLGTRQGTAAPLVGYFRHGSKGGCVGFVSSHFALQKNKDEQFTFQNLLLNFLIEALENNRARSGK